MYFSNYSFTCKSGQCIDDTLLCDGGVHCNDESDETEEACSSHKCPGYGFRCDYGGCVAENVKCNGIFDCPDKSDEKGCPSTRAPPTTSKPPTTVPPTIPTKSNK